MKTKKRRKPTFIKYGDRFGKWTVVGMRAQYPSGGTNPHWLCRCGCSSLSVVGTAALSTGRSLGCVECRNDRMRRGVGTDLRNGQKCGTVRR